MYITLYLIILKMLKTEINISLTWFQYGKCITCLLLSLFHLFTNSKRVSKFKLLSSFMYSKVTQ